MNDPDRTPPPKPGILVIDDEATVREVLAIALREAGCSVWLACCGEDALAIAQKHASEITAAFIDIDMPGLNGLQTLALLREAMPDLRCFLMSGRTGYLSEDDLQQLGAERFLAKPFRLAEIVQYVRPLSPRPAPGPA